jgi:bacteriocin-like protein
MQGKIMANIKITDLHSLNQINKPSEKQLNQMFDEIESEAEQLSNEELSKIVGGHGSGGWSGIIVEEHGSSGWGGLS